MILSERMALVTGASRGIGAAVARALARRGARVAVTYTQDYERAQQVTRSIVSDGGTAAVYRMDISDADSVGTAMRDIVHDHARIDILVNNAGVFGARALMDIDHAFFAQQFGTNVWGMIQVIQAGLPHFPDEGGRIVNLSSQRIFQPKDGTGVYAASKAAVSALTRALAIELGPRRITVDAVAPATTNTDMTAAAPAAKKAAVAEATPLRRLAEPEDIADVVAFLASDDARWITGRTLLADGGLT